MNDPLDHARGLLRKASHDLVAAEATLGTGQALDMVCFHAQQATEKSLKALLALDDVEYPWRHDLGELLELASPGWPELVNLQDEIIALAPFAVAVRYEDAVDPPLDEARSGLGTAQKVYRLAQRAFALRSDHE